MKRQNLIMGRSLCFICLILILKITFSQSERSEKENVFSLIRVKRQSIENFETTTPSTSESSTETPGLEDVVTEDVSSPKIPKVVEDVIIDSSNGTEGPHFETAHNKLTEQNKTNSTALHETEANEPTTAALPTEKIQTTSETVQLSSEPTPTSTEIIPTSSETTTTSSGTIPTSSELTLISSEIPTSSETIPTSSETIPTPSEIIPTSSETIPTSSETISTSSELTLTSSQIPTSSETIPTSSETIPTPSETIPTSSETIQTSSETIPTSTETIPISSETIPTSSETIPTSSETTPTSSETIPTSSETIQTSSETIPTSSETIPTPSEIIPTSSETIPTSSETIPTSTETIPISSETIPTSSETIQTSSETIPTSSETIPTSSETIPTPSEIIPTSSETIQTSSETIPTSTETIPISSETIPTSSETIPTSSETIPTSSETIPTSSQTILTSTETIQTSTETLAIPMSSETIPTSEPTPTTSETVPIPLNQTTLSEFLQSSTEKVFSTVSEIDTNISSETPQTSSETLLTLSFEMSTTSSPTFSETTTIPSLPTFFSEATTSVTTLVETNNTFSSKISTTFSKTPDALITTFSTPSLTSTTENSIVPTTHNSSFSISDSVVALLKATTMAPSISNSSEKENCTHKVSDFKPNLAFLNSSINATEIKVSELFTENDSNLTESVNSTSEPPNKDQHLGPLLIISNKEPFEGITESDLFKSSEPGDNTNLISSSGSTSLGCLHETEERFQRNVLATSFSMLNEEPTMLLFSKTSSCVATLNKYGKQNVQSIRRLFPKFPATLQVEAAGFIRERVYLLDSSEDQNIWGFSYSKKTTNYKVRSELKSKERFLEQCGILVSPKTMDIRAFGQVSLNDPTCILFNSMGDVLLSENPSEDAILLSKVITFLLEKEFVTYVESMFAWLDEPFITSIFIYGSNGELYRIFREDGDVWKTKNYEVIPYNQLPIIIKNRQQISV